MPNRIIKESICRSDSIDTLSWFEEVLFYRLIVVCDDYGRFDGRPAVIKGSCFPLKDDITKKHISEAIEKLSTAGLVRGYTVQGRPYLQLTTWNCHQQIRAKNSKYPSPDEECSQNNADDTEKNQNTASDITCNQMISSDCNSPRNRESKYGNRESEYGDETRARVSVPPVRLFEEFWEAYPSRKGRHPAEKEYCDLIRSGAVTEEILVSAARNYAECCKSLEDKRYIKHACNFLRECAFEDYLDTKHAGPAAREELQPEEEELIDDEEWWKYGPNAWED